MNLTLVGIQRSKCVDLYWYRLRFKYVLGHEKINVPSKKKTTVPLLGKLPFWPGVDSIRLAIDKDG